MNNVSKEELLFLHLYENDDKEENYYSSEKLTQKGIQKSLKCNIGLISRLLKKNEEKGLIRRKKSKIIDSKRTQIVFLLTKQGKRVAKEISNNCKEK